MEVPIRGYLLLATFVSAACGALRVQLLVPAMVDIREDAVLSCKFFLGNAHLYSVKWYKNEFEFFQYTPANKPAVKTFPVDGITLDINRSNMTTVVLTHLSFNSSGNYRCEVSGEAPSFLTATQNASMTVTALPQDRPEIRGLSPVSSPGETLSANCTAASSQPAPSLAWFVNGFKVHSWPSQYRLSPVDELDDRGLVRRSLGLTFKLGVDHFGPRGTLLLRCVASLHDLLLDREVEVRRAALSNQHLRQDKSSAASVAPTGFVLTAALVVLWRQC